MAELKAKYNVVDRLAPPRLDFEFPAFATVQGVAAADVSVVLFSDFLCPACRRLSVTLKRLRKDHPTVRWILAHLPSNRHALSTRAALTAQCTGVGSQWRFYDAVFESEGELTDAALLTAVQKLGLATEEVETCMSKATANEDLERHLSFARSLGVSVTPTLFINGRMILGSVPWMELDRIIRAEIAAAGGGSGPKTQSLATYARTPE